MRQREAATVLALLALVATKTDGTAPAAAVARSPRLHQWRSDGPGAQSWLLADVRRRFGRDTGAASEREQVVGMGNGGSSAAAETGVQSKQEQLSLVINHLSACSASAIADGVGCVLAAVNLLQAAIGHAWGWVPAANGMRWSAGAAAALVIYLSQRLTPMPPVEALRPSCPAPPGIAWRRKSGSLRGGYLTLDLQGPARVGGLFFYNRAGKRDRSGKMIPGGAKRVLIESSLDGRVWRVAHCAWLRPGTSQALEQYVMLASPLEMRFIRVSSHLKYEAG